jgi:hypothetical protein
MTERQLKLERLYWKVQANMYHHEVIAFRFFGGIQNKARVSRLYHLGRKIGNKYQEEFGRSILTGRRKWK